MTEEINFPSDLIEKYAHAEKIFPELTINKTS